MVSFIFKQLEWIWEFGFCYKLHYNPCLLLTTRSSFNLYIFQWVRKDIYFVVKNRILVNKGKIVKLFAAKDIQKIDGVWTAKTLQMITTKNKKLVHKSVFQLKNVRYNSNVDDSIFETEVMQRGL